jgi:RNA polymerase sigma-70 factor, ECF subfamily
MEALLGRHYERVHTICRRIANNDADADDACQEALLAIVRGLSRFDGRSSFKTWSYRVASNACLDELRRKNRRPRPRAELPDDPEPGTGFDATLVDRLTIDDALPRLSEEFRVPVVLRDVAGLDYAEIAEVLGIPPGTVRSRIARGRRQLCDLLGNQIPPGERQR